MHDFGGDRVGAVLHVDRRVLEHRGAARIVDVAIGGACGQRLRLGHAGLHPGVERQHVVLRGLGPPEVDQLSQLLRMLRGKVVALREVLGDVVQLPLLGVQHRLGQLDVLFLFGDRLPAISPDRPRADHLVVLHRLVGRGGRCIEGVGEAGPLDRRLGHAVDLVGASMPSASSTVGTTSVTWAYWPRTSPLAAMPFGQWTTNASLMPPWCRYRFQRFSGVLPAQAQPQE